MAKKLVKKNTYYFWNFCYHLLCLSGLIWQVTQISMSLFKFDVNKDINVFTPDQNDSKERTIDMCFRSSEIVRDKLYRKVVREMSIRNHSPVSNAVIDNQDKFKMLNQMTLKDRFDITLDTKLVLNYPKIEEFIMGQRYCYRYPVTNKLSLNPVYLTDVNIYSVSLSQYNVSFNPRRLVFFRLLYRNMTVMYRTKSFPPNSQA